MSSRNKTVTSWSHSWVVLSVVLKFPFAPSRRFSLPIGFRLHLNRDSAKKHRRKYRKKTSQAIELLKVLVKRYPQQKFHLLTDSGYGNQQLLLELPRNVEVTSRLTLDARLYGVPEQKKGRGRPRVRGMRLDSPQQMLNKRCSRAKVQMYGKTWKLKYKSCSARLHHLPRKSLKIVAVEHLNTGRKRQVFFSTVENVEALELLEWYSWRWSIEVSFRDSKQQLGFEEPQGWSRKAVQRTAPVAMLLYSLVLLWFSLKGYKHKNITPMPWYPHKSTTSFADMLSSLRVESLKESFLQHPLDYGMFEKSIKELIFLYSYRV